MKHRRFLLFDLPLYLSVLLFCIGAAGVAGCGGAQGDNRGELAAPTPRQGIYAPRATRTPTATELASLGRAMFFDPALSASGRMSCASCHDPAHAFGPPNALSVQAGGIDGRAPGVRAAPSLRYLQTLEPFSEHHHEDEGDDSVDGGPTGGHTWDGRAGSAHEQARLPLLSAEEMANGTPAAVVGRLKAAACAERFRQVFGAGIFDAQNTQAAFDAAALALEVFEQTPADFYPYSSRYDEVLRGRATLSAAEARGLAVFNDPAKGNCASCHQSARTADGAFPLFTDFGHVALGVPRNPAIAANANPAYHDLGLCGPYRTDLADHADDCGRFRAPSLRNVALRGAFFHNGAFHSLADVLRFYAERDTRPALFYPRDASGRVVPYDDLPPAYRANVNQDPPFGRRPGQAAAMTARQQRDVIAFLNALTDADLRRTTPPSTARQTRAARSAAAP